MLVANSNIKPSIMHLEITRQPIVFFLLTRQSLVKRALFSCAFLILGITHYALFRNACTFPICNDSFLAGVNIPVWLDQAPDMLWAAAFAYALRAIDIKIFLCAGWVAACGIFFEVCQLFFLQGTACYLDVFAYIIGASLVFLSREKIPRNAQTS